MYLPSLERSELDGNAPAGMWDVGVVTGSDLRKCYASVIKKIGQNFECTKRWCSANPCLAAQVLQALVYPHHPPYTGMYHALMGHSLFSQPSSGTITPEVSRLIIVTSQAGTHHH